MILNRTGEHFVTNEGCRVEIIEYYRNNNCTIQFEDGYILRNRCYSDIKRGQIKNPNHASIFETGYLGVGKYLYSNYKECYNIWASIIQRCYAKNKQKNHSTYKDVTIYEEWKCFQNFAQWHEENYKEGFSLDKDILIKGNKIYSPQTCCFVPQVINTLFVKNEVRRGELPIGVRIANKKFQARFTKNNVEVHLGTFDTIEEAFEAYKTAKEAYIKEVADEWKPLIAPNVYEAMYNYQVEITD